MLMLLDKPIAWPLNWTGPYALQGLGATSTAPVSTQVEAAGASVIGVAGSILALSPATGPLAPFVAAAAAIVGILATLGVGSGCGQTCVLSSQYANQAEAALAQNIQAYFAIPPPRDPASQQAAIALFNQVWADLVAQCSVASLGTAGQKCISDRQAGACTWKQTTTSPLLSIPGEPQPGACWNWFSGYLTPIQNDPNVASTTAATSAETAALSAGSALSSSSSLPWLLGAAALVAIFLVAK